MSLNGFKEVVTSELPIAKIGVRIGILAMYAQDLEYQSLMTLSWGSGTSGA
ncbi:hypothetical protein PROVRUST_05916 [Providencia rustigianii DSM 4541]|uniref:Uncharacterized protein n=1 Tax=Providencia rustigianii DSM 4541 TaxID=500637 RepID=D1P198_9GAMM|nr:hypothetical protein PROVRUST_05916 [Providencia rustigianii DSM 4541]SUC25146.1 Uncharacterised protein [Providencia rustigianii]